jgi:hypothetical protein
MEHALRLIQSFHAGNPKTTLHGACVAAHGGKRDMMEDPRRLRSEALARKRRDESCFGFLWLTRLPRLGRIHEDPT